MFLTFLTVLLGALLLYAVWPQKEGLSDTSTAAMNAANIKDLNTRMDALKKLSEQVTRIQTLCDANTENISTLTENCK